MSHEPAYSLVRIKRAWVPNWLWVAYAYTLPPWVWPFRQILTATVKPDFC